ncbi:hypothetical protein QJ48_02410 [Paenibacillus sp. A3]|uniref:ATP-binding protein n=1 Tax=Paenibacillus sp. A3 TaxID=1337054 RepID=UPI0006D5AD53|nr:ATP-binding protein [Paenibacillus sp. A3]KPV60943.1 hypothetical protein QJ48_02410 [Paenibacillus sp. A3]
MAKFRTRARAVDLLGKQQIRDEVTAISELLRNSYDADAFEGLVNINTSNQSIVVWDDGDGMDAEDLEQNWLTIGTYSKKGKIQKSRKGRVKIGEKGIGRLAVSLLGDQLLLISKKRYKGSWSLLYLHWELFRNERLFLEDIEIPVKNFSSFDELVTFLKNNVDELKNILVRNLNDKNNWDADKRNEVITQINSFTINNQVFDLLKLNENRGGGTLFYLANIDTTWDWNIYETQIKDESLQVRVRRLKDILYSFQNYIDLFDEELEKNTESEEEKKEETIFIPKIHINGKPMEDETWFNQEDIGLYDYALKGQIQNGVFQGKAFMRGLKSIENVRAELTEGIDRRTLKDCGPIKLKWYFVEGSADLSSLNKDEHKRMNDKLNNIGGVYVYRDGLRILPYGETGNDFLNMEERRSLRARTYLFSHRRMFGFMEISKAENPNLVDKSSREGFVENATYNYFRTVGINLLKWWAIQYLETLKDDGKRDSYINYYKSEYEKAEKARQSQKDEEKKEKEHLKDLRNKLSRDTNSIELLTNRLQKDVVLRIEEGINRITNANSRFNQEQFFYSLKLNLYETISQINSVKIEINPRYQYPYDLLDMINTHNNRITVEQLNLTTFIEEELDKLKQKIDNSNLKFKLNVLEQLDQAIDWIDDFCNNKYSKLGNSYSISIQNLLNEVSQEFLQVINNLIKENKKDISIYLERLAVIKKQMIQQKLQSKAILLAEKNHLEENIQNTIKEFENVTKEIQEKIIIHEDQLRNSTEYKVIKEYLENMRDQNVINSLNKDQFLIGLLKKEVDMYRDISAVGLAAEMTSHEFNSLHRSIKENVDVLSKALKPTPAWPIIEKVRQAFESLERLHQRMSPLYRQSRSRSKEINLKTFLESLLDYFKTDINKYSVSIVNHIPNDLTIKEIESVLFTPLANLISNSIYWMLDRERRELHFYYSDTDNILFVHDTGTGIKEMDRLRIFEPYFSKKLEGRGLGLFLSRDTLESRGHSLYFEDNVNVIKNLEGACFCIKFKKETIVEKYGVEK